MANLKSQQVTEYVKIGLYLSLAYFGFKAIKSLAESFGLSKTESEVLTDEATTDVAQSTTEASSNPFLSFSPMYSNALVTAWKKSHPNQAWNITKQEKLPRLQYLDLAKDINESNGYFNDDVVTTIYDPTTPPHDSCDDITCDRTHNISPRGSDLAVEASAAPLLQSFLSVPSPRQTWH